jgi:hypothetical protein
VLYDTLAARRTVLVVPVVDSVIVSVPARRPANSVVPTDTPIVQLPASVLDRTQLVAPELMMKSPLRKKSMVTGVDDVTTTCIPQGNP